LRFFIAGETDVRYLEDLIDSGDGPMRKCALQTADEDMGHHEMELTINPAAKRVQVVSAGGRMGIWLDLYGGRARILRCEEPDVGFELTFGDQPVPDRFLKAAQTHSARLLQPA
jgi:hypothetical protein